MRNMAVRYLGKSKGLLPSKPTLEDGLHGLHRSDGMMYERGYPSQPCLREQEMEQPGCPSVGERRQQMNVMKTTHQSERKELDLRAATQKDVNKHINT